MSRCALHCWRDGGLSRLLVLLGRPVQHAEPGGDCLILWRHSLPAWPLLLQLMLGNVVDTAYDAAATLHLKLEVLEAFFRNATREGLRCVYAIGRMARATLG